MKLEVGKYSTRPAAGWRAVSRMDTYIRGWLRFGILRTIFGQNHITGNVFKAG